MKLKLINCFDDIIDIKISDKKLKNMAIALYEIISGDEVLTIYYKDGTFDEFDSDTHYRHSNYNDERFALTTIDDLKLINKLPLDVSSYKRALCLNNLLEGK